MARIDADLALIWEEFSFRFIEVTFQVNDLLIWPVFKPDRPRVRAGKWRLIAGSRIAIKSRGPS